MSIRTILPLCAVAAALPAADLSTASGIAEQLEARYLDERRAAVKAIDKLDETEQRELAPAILPIMRIDHWDNRIRIAAEAMAAIGDEASAQLPTLIERLWQCAEQDRGHLSSYYSRAIVGIAAGDDAERDDERALRSLLQLMQESRDRGDRQRFDQLGKALTADGADAADDLIALFKNAEAELRPLVLNALGALGSDASAAIPVLVAAGTDADAAEREQLQHTIDAVKADNQAPSAAAVSVDCIEGRSCRIDLPASDTDDLLLTATVAEQPAHGSLERIAATSFTYTAEAGHRGTVTFAWQSDDGMTTSPAATVTVTVAPDNTAPQVVDIAGAGEQAITVHFNESLDPASAGDPANYRLIDGPAISSAELGGDGASVTLTVAGDLTTEQRYELAYADVADASAAGNSSTGQQSFIYRAVEPGLVCHQILASGGDLKDPAALPSAEAQVVVDRIDLEDARPRKKNYGLDFIGKIQISQAGAHRFRLESDDGSHLWIDGQQLIDNGGFHGMEEETASIDLQPGLYDLRVYFFQGSGGQGLECQWRPPGADTWQDIAADRLCH